MPNAKKVLMIITPKDFRDEELIETKDVLEKANVMVTVASTVAGTAKGMFGAKFEVKDTVDKANPADYDAVVVVGGSGSQTYLWGNSIVQKIVQDANKLGRIVSAICISPVVLARAGLLAGKRATVFPMDAAVKELKKGGANVSGALVEVDGKIITGRGPEAAGEFGRKILEALRC